MSGIRHAFVFQEFRVGSGWLVDEFDLTDTNSNNVWLMEGATEGLGNPEFEYFVQNSANRDGQSYEGWRALPREVFWPLAIDAVDGDVATWNTLQKRFWATMRPATTNPDWRVVYWQVTNVDDTVRTLPVRYVSEESPVYDVDPSGLLLEVHGINLIADDAWWRGPIVTHVFQTPGDTVPFFGPDGYGPDFYIMSANTVASFEITPTGDRGIPISPVWTIYGGASGFTLRSSIDLMRDTYALVSPTIVPDGAFLTINTDPRVQTAYLSVPNEFGGFDITNVSWDMTWGNTVLNALETTTWSLELNGPGSAQLQYEPKFFRGF
jgi:hypothetical protein